MLFQHFVGILVHFAYIHSMHVFIQDKKNWYIYLISLLKPQEAFQIPVTYTYKDFHLHKHQMNVHTCHGAHVPYSGECMAMS